MDNKIDLTDYRLGFQNYKDKNYRIAIKHLNDYLTNFHIIFRHEAFLLKGICQYFIQEYDDSIKSITISIESSLLIKNDQPYYYRGLSYAKLDDYNNAIADFRRAIELNKEYIYSYIELYEAFKVCNVEKEAEEILRVILSKDYRNIELIVDQAKKAYDLDYVDLAQKICSDVLNIKSDEPNALQYRAFSNSRLKNTNLAIDDMNKLINILEGKTSDLILGQTYLNRGLLLKNLGLTEQAKSDFIRAYKLGQENAFDFI